jgi:CBS domain-containing protein
LRKEIEMAERLANEIMNKNVVTITQEKSIKELAQLLTDNDISGVPVVDKKNILQGIVSETDIVDFVKKDQVFFPMLIYPVYNYAYVNPELYTKGYEKNKEALSKTKVEEIMHTWVKKAKKDTPESEIANLMIENAVNRVPIVDENNKVIGIIARRDLVESMIRKGHK